MVRYLIKVKGIVQGVGFRPYVFRMAEELSLSGFVYNTAEGVSIEIEGKRAVCESFLSGLKDHPPSQASVESVDTLEIPLVGSTDFRILPSREGVRSTLISSDIGICEDCIRDITTKGNRRYGYAFTNCTNCGPRFTILYDVPYDRKNTTMADFPLCSECRAEYENPCDRRFHAQPNACPVCGPSLSFYFYREGKIQLPKNQNQLSKNQNQDPKNQNQDPKNQNQVLYKLFHQYIRRGQIVALKGIGGYHLVCDAANEAAVRRLRKKKLRYDKPFAVMMKDVETVEKYCEINSKEKAVLASARKPIVLLKKKVSIFHEGNEGANVLAQSITQRNHRIGVMLPYTPLHYILMQEQQALVMTSGNLSDRPMIFRDEEALLSLSSVADAILTHNRPIHRRLDDSVCMIIGEKLHIIRRARGFVPEPLPLSGNTGVILALGAQQKNTFCLAKGENAFLSGHIGDLDEKDTSQCFEDEIQSFIRIFDAKPQLLVCDMHPDYISTRYAYAYQKKQLANSGKKLPILAIQHHHAHFASVLAEHRVEGDLVLGLIFDGTGFGEDGCIWGGEALLGNVGESKRIGHLFYFPLLGGEAAVREPWRTALAVADMALGRKQALSLFPDCADAAKLLLLAGERGVNAPLASSMGRLFDAVAAMTGIRMQTTYEGQAAIELQQVMDETAEGIYHFAVFKKDDMLLFDWRPLICEIYHDLQVAVTPGVISMRFHRAVIELLTQVAVMVRKQNGSNTVVLSGGVFQNDYLLEYGTDALKQKGFTVYSNEMIPMNDGGICFGQAAVASYRMR
jgi:hydrogenase maturation protein HypF